MAFCAPHVTSPAFRALFGDARRREILHLAALFPDRAANVDEMSFVRCGSFARDALSRDGVARDLDHVTDRPASPVEAPSAIRVVAWNVERGRDLERWAALPPLRSADVLLLCEVDDGMARSHNADVAADLARRLHLHYAFVPSYFEFTRGTNRERKRTRGAENARGFHGNAILSRFPLRDARRIPLPVKFDWFRHYEQRIGTRVALAVTVDLPAGPVTAVSVHLEAFATPLERASQMRALLDALGEGTNPVIMGGDFNTLGARPSFPDALGLVARRLAGQASDAAHREPLFEDAKRAGFVRCEMDARVVTWRVRRKWPRMFGAKLDWIFARGLQIEGGGAILLSPPCTSSGVALSDHDGISARLTTLPHGFRDNE